MKVPSFVLVCFHKSGYGMVNADDTKGPTSDVATCSVYAQGVEDCLDRSSSSSIPVIIVDEHHHVADHWFSLSGVRENHVYNATLVHIDGHADDGIPLTKDLLAPFPQDLNRLREDLENDQFIVMAIRHGLIGRVVNVFPFFSYRYVHPDTNFIYYQTVGMHKSGTGWCQCASNCRQRDSCKRLCEVEEEEVSPGDCEIEREIEIATYGINRAMAEGFSIDASQPLIIDIDEDFFAVESPFIKSMLTGHLAKEQADSAQVERHGFAAPAWQNGNILQRIQQRILFAVFCARPPRTQQRERAVDVFMRGLEAVVLSMKESKKMMNPARMQAVVLKFMYINTTLLHEVSDALCKKQIRWKNGEQKAPNGGDVIVLSETTFDELLSKEDEELIQKVASMFAWTLYTQVPKQGIFKLISYGFCIHCNEVPRAGYYLWACLGSSLQTDQTNLRLELHDPIEGEVARELGRLRSMMLESLKFPPTMVTICRSSRDGYTPRELWSEIEDGVLEIIGTLSHEWGRSIEVQNDRDCYWGARSTPARTVLPIKNFLHSEGLSYAGFYSSMVVKH